MRRFLTRSLVAVAASIVALPALAQRGAITVPRNLDEMTDRAADIVHGTVIEARVEKHPELSNLDTIVVSLRVIDTLKGSAHGTYTFRQYIWDVRDRHDAAGYRKNQELLLLMNAPSRYGLTSPVGIEQGRFRIQRAGARASALNGTGNLRLFAGLSLPAARPAGLTARQESLVAKHRRGPVDLDELTSMIRAYAGNE